MLEFRFFEPQPNHSASLELRLEPCESCPSGSTCAGALAPPVANPGGQLAESLRHASGGVLLGCSDLENCVFCVFFGENAKA